MSAQMDDYLERCREEAGENPLLTLVESAIELYDCGFGSRSQKAFDARRRIGSCVVVLHGAPTAFRGNLFPNPDAPIYPGTTPDPTRDPLAVLRLRLEPGDVVTWGARVSAFKVVDESPTGLTLEDEAGDIDVFAVRPLGLGKLPPGTPLGRIAKPSVNA